MKLEEMYSNYKTLTNELDAAAREKDLYCCIHWDNFPYLRILFGRHGVYFADWRSDTNKLHCFHHNSAVNLCMVLLEEFITSDPIEVVQL